jgi:hypothetical protein
MYLPAEEDIPEGPGKTGGESSPLSGHGEGDRG